MLSASLLDAGNQLRDLWERCGIRLAPRHGVRFTSGGGDFLEVEDAAAFRDYQRHILGLPRGTRLAVINACIWDQAPSSLCTLRRGLDALMRRRL